MYSCALWDRAENGVRGDIEFGPTVGDLEAAQRRKLHHVLRKARVKPGHRILEFGSGWGGMAIEVGVYLLRFFWLGLTCYVTSGRLRGPLDVRSTR